MSIKQVKKAISVFLALAILFAGVPVFGTLAQAASGTCGTNATWNYEESTGTLTISGTGKMTDYSASLGDEAPWHVYSSSIKAVIINDGITSIGDTAFLFCSELTSVSIADSVTRIGKSAFSNCLSLSEITIPDSVETIGANCFSETAYYNDSNNWQDHILYIGHYLIIADVTESSGSYAVKPGTKCIADSAFYYNQNLTSLTIPDSVTSIGEDAFFLACQLTEILVDKNNPNYSSDENGVLYNKDKTELIIHPSGNPRTSFSIPDSVTGIGDFAFYTCDYLISVTIPDSVTGIGDSAFGDCELLSSITIPGSVTSIGNNAFMQCARVKDITIGNGVTSIGDCAFDLCPQLVSVIIPSNVVSIGKGALKWSDKAVIYGYADSYAETYANENSIPFVPIDLKSTFNVSYNANGGTGAPAQQTKTEGVALTLSSAKPTRGGYTFKGWAETSNAQTAAYQPGASFTKDANTTLYAVWQKTETPPAQPKVKKVELSNVSINYKASAALKPTITADDGAEYTVKYESSNPDTVSVNEKTGEIYGAKKGTATIKVTVTDNTGKTVTATCKVTVKYAVWQWLIIYVLFGWIWYK